MIYVKETQTVLSLFLYGVRECYNLIDLHVALQLSQHHF